MGYTKAIYYHREELLLKRINHAVDRFCALHPELGIPNLIRYVLAANVALYLLELFGNGTIAGFLALNPYAILHGQFWRMITFALLPDSSGIWLIFFCLFYNWIGTILEQAWGSTKFTVYYISGVLLTAVGAILAYLIDGYNYAIYGATYVNTAMFIAFAAMNPNAMVRVYFIIPVKIKWLAWLEGGLYLVQVISNALAGLWGIALMPVIAMLNLLIFLSPAAQQAASRATARRHAKSYQHRTKAQTAPPKGYYHRCSVCGKTDTDYPDLQFRYCSKCSGYHCYCSEHLFSHIHVTEE